MPIIDGTELDDIIDGPDTNDTINGLGGADDIEGRGGADILNGGDGNDFLKGDGGDAYNGLSGNDTLNGGLGDDVLRGGAGVDIFNGGDGIDRASFFARAATQGAVANLSTQAVSNDGFGNAETMTSIESLGGGTAFVDTFTGDGGANLIIGGIGDIISGLGGDDLFELDGAAATLDGGLGIDTLASFNNSVLVVDGNADGLADVVLALRGVEVDLSTGSIVDDGYGNIGTLISIENVGGGDFGDRITGDNGVNLLNGFGGADTLEGLGGGDILDGGSGDDILRGDGDDSYLGPSGNDTLNGGTGEDVLRGGAGVDILNGGDGVDRASFFTRAATQGVIASLLTQTVANDGYGNAETMTSIEGLGGGTAFVDNFTGDTDANFIIGGLGDIIAGLGGDDVFELDGAVATLNGGAGNDTLESFTGRALVADTNADGLAETIVALQGVIVNLAAGSIVNDGFGNTGVLISIENVGGSNLADQLTGTNLANILQGFDGQDVLNGGGGNDVLDGGSSGDVLNGGAGADTMIGGTGNDTYVVNVLADLTLETSPIGGTDTVEAALTWTLGANIERLILTGGSTINGTGNSLNNRLTGNAAANSLNGLGGADEMIGGDGNDTYFIDHAGDVASEIAPTGGIDVVRSTISWTLGANLERLILLGAVAIDATGNTQVNVLVGNSAANTLSGGLGNDNLTGGAGADNFVFNTAAGAGNVDTITDYSVVDDTIRLENAVFLGIGAEGAALTASRFFIGAAAADASDRFIYNSVTGGLFFDSDGNGAAAQIQIATLSTGLALTAADFFVI